MAVTKRKVVVLDDDRDVADLVQSILTDEGFAVSCLYGLDDATVDSTIKDLAPDCVVLDGTGPHSAEPWALARSLASRRPPIPTVLLSGRPTSREEAMLGESERARSSAISAVVAKPFDIDRLVAAVKNAMCTTAPSEASREAAAADTDRLRQRLRDAGALDPQTSNAGREWVTFRASTDGDLFKVYRWHQAGTYFVGRYAPNGERLLPLSELPDADAAMEYCERLIEYERGADR